VAIIPASDWEYFKSVRVYIALSAFIFLAAAVMGYYEAENNPELAASWLQELEMLKWIMSLPAILIMIIIFLKNFLACAMSVLLGLGLGIIPLLVATSNGFLLGIVSYGVVQKQGLLYLLAGILPHGIIELPTVLVSIALGIRLGHLLALSLLGEKTDLAGEARKAAHFLYRWALPLLLLAAFVEAFITPIALSVVA
jgi:stage II sporulation protein M